MEALLCPCLGVPNICNLTSLAGPSSPVPLYVSNSEYRGHSDWPRSHSLDPGSHNYNSIPRNKGHSKAKSGHQPRPSSGPDGGAPRDVFKGRVDFKSILRRFDPKDDERSLGTPSNPGRLLSASRDPPAMHQVWLLTPFNLFE